MISGKRVDIVHKQFIQVLETKNPRKIIIKNKKAIFLFNFKNLQAKELVEAIQKGRRKAEKN